MIPGRCETVFTSRACFNFIFMKKLPPPVVVLYDGEHVQLLHFPNKSGFTLLTFDIMHAKANGRNAFGKNLCSKLGLNLLAIVPKHPCWYPASEMDHVGQICRKHIDHPAIAYGASMGGYGALRWGRVFGANHALACSPQVTIDPRINREHDRRYSRFYIESMHKGMEVTADHLNASTVILYDPGFFPDRFQAEMFMQLRQGVAVPTHNMSHNTASCISGSANALSIFSSLMSNKIDDLRKAVTERRKSSERYYVEMADMALRLNRHDLSARLVEYIRYRDPISFHMFMGKHSLKLNDRDKAAAHFVSVLELRPDHKIANLRMSNLAS